MTHSQRLRQLADRTGLDGFAEELRAMADELDGAAQHDPVNGVRVPLDVLEAAESSLGRFCSDLGWGDDDMQNMDNLSAYIARYKAVKSRKIITEYKTFTAPRYRDPNGAPTCCADVLYALEAGKHYAEEALSRHVEAYGRHPATEPEHNAIVVDIATIDDAINKAIETKRNQHDKT